MRSLVTLALWACFLFASCGIPSEAQVSSGSTSYSSSNPVFISKDTANVMIKSYLTSIGDPVDSINLRALILNGDSLRAYLNDTSIRHVKVMLAHSLDYIHSGKAGQPAGYRQGALTIVVAGYNRSGNYVYRNGTYLLNMAAPCPPYCAISGTAAQNLFP